MNYEVLGESDVATTSSIPRARLSFCSSSRLIQLRKQTKKSIKNLMRSSNNRRGAAKSVELTVLCLLRELKSLHVQSGNKLSQKVSIKKSQKELAEIDFNSNRKIMQIREVKIINKKRRRRRRKNFSHVW